MRLRNITGSREVIADSPYVVPEDTLEACPGTWHEIFGNDHPIHIEIGMGKGRFLHTLAKSNPQINYVGIEKYSSVLLRAIQKMEEDELPNLKFIRMDAEDIDKVFGKGEVDRIYLNFSDPWPKSRHEKRRLTYRHFLQQYQAIMAPNGILQFKTDNQGLFEFSLVSMNNYGMVFDLVALDLHHDPRVTDNIETEYEHKFSSQGGRIYELVARFPQA